MGTCGSLGSLRGGSVSILRIRNVQRALELCVNSLFLFGQFIGQFFVVVKLLGEFVLAPQTPPFTDDSEEAASHPRRDDGPESGDQQKPDDRDIFELVEKPDRRGAISAGSSETLK